MPRFVLLYHDCPLHYQRPSHWDLMLEESDLLRTWALETLPRQWAAAHARTAHAYSNCPSNAAGNEVAAEQLGEHRRVYLEFEGQLTGDRGAVIRIAAGTYVSEAKSSGRWQLSLSGDTLSGAIALQRTNPNGVSWRLECLRAT